MAREDKQLHTYLPADLHRRLTLSAASHQRSLSAEVAFRLRQAMDMDAAAPAADGDASCLPEGAAPQNEMLQVLQAIRAEVAGLRADIAIKVVPHEGATLGHNT